MVEKPERFLGVIFTVRRAVFICGETEAGVGWVNGLVHGCGEEAR